MSEIDASILPSHETPLIYRLHHLILAICVVLGILAMLAVVVTSPQYYGTQNGVPAMMSTFASANTTLMQAHFFSDELAIYLLPVSFLAMAWLAMRRSPWLASFAMLVVFISTVPFAAFAAQDGLTYDLAHMGSNPLLVTIAEQFNNDGIMSYYNALFIIGTVLAPFLIGIALWRTKAVPRWAAALITFGRLLVFAYPFIQTIPGVYIQTLSWSIVLIGSIPAAMAIMKSPGSVSVN